MPRVSSSKKELEIVLPRETKKFDIYKAIKEAAKQLEKLETEFEKYEISVIIIGVSMTASVPPSLTGSVSATLTKKKH